MVRTADEIARLANDQQLTEIFEDDFRVADMRITEWKNDSESNVKPIDGEIPVYRSIEQKQDVARGYWSISEGFVACMASITRVAEIKFGILLRPVTKIHRSADGRELSRQYFLENVDQMNGRY